MKFGSNKDQPSWLGSASSTGRSLEFNASKPPASTASLVYNNPSLSPNSLKNLTQAYQQPANQPVQDLPVVPPINSSSSNRGPAAPGMQWVQQPGGGYKQFAIPGYVAPNGGITTGGNMNTTNTGAFGLGNQQNPNNYLGDIYDPTAAQDIIKKMAEQGLLSAQDAEKMQRERLGIAETESEARIRRETETQNQLLNTMFEPQRQQLADNLNRTIETADLTSASAGSVRGSRQSDKIVQLNQVADAARAALDAQQQAQLRLYQAQLRGAEASELKVYQDAVANAEGDVKAAQNTFAQAQQGVLASQLEQQEKKQAAQADAYKTYLDETGQVLDPMTGQLINSLSGMEKQAKIDETVANSILKDAQGVEAKANAAKLLDAITRGNYVSNSFSDEFGNTSIQVFNADTGASEIIDVGKISKPAAELLKAMYGKASGGGGGTKNSGGGIGDYGFNPQQARLYEEILGSSDPISSANQLAASKDGGRGLLDEALRYEQVKNMGFSGDMQAAQYLVDYGIASPQDLVGGGKFNTPLPEGSSPWIPSIRPAWAPAVGASQVAPYKPFLPQASAAQVGKSNKPTRAF